MKFYLHCHLALAPIGDLSSPPPTQPLKGMFMGMVRSYVGILRGTTVILLTTIADENDQTFLED